jgi:hypothetical protein
MFVGPGHSYCGPLHLTVVLLPCLTGDNIMGSVGEKLRHTRVRRGLYEHD